MSPEVLRYLRAHGFSIRGRWEALTRIEAPVTTLAPMDSLIRSIPVWLEEIFVRLGRPPEGNGDGQPRLPELECGNNPFRAFFVAGENALVEALVLRQAEHAFARADERDINAVAREVRRLALDEMDAFCDRCPDRCIHPRCRHGRAPG